MISEILIVLGSLDYVYFDNADNGTDMIAIGIASGILCLL